MRFNPLAAAVSAAALMLAAAPALAQDAGITDAELAQFAGAMQRMQSVMAQVQGGAPTDEQQAEMADAVESSGLEISRFNAISQSVSTDPVTRARIEVATAPESPAGSVGAGVSDDEAAQYARAEIEVRAVAASGAPAEEQQARMAAAITGAGLDLERFNAIAGATAADERLRARIAVERARAGG